MAVKLETGSPMAKALEEIITDKLLEVGWSSDPQDKTFTEYIILMLVNGKDQDEVARELSGDLLRLDPDDQSAVEFAQWLFHQIDMLNNQNGAGNGQMHIPTGPAADADMSDTGDGSKAIPTGPKAMRNGTQGNRMFSQINRNMDRSSDPLHRIQGGSGRINSHNTRTRQRGGRGDQIQRNFDTAARRQMQNATMNPMMQQQQQQQQGFGFPMQPGMQADPNQIMMRMFEEQAAMIQQLASQIPPPGSQPQQGHGKPFDRNRGGRGQNRRGRGDRQHQSQKHGATQDDDTTMGDESVSAENEESKDPYKSLCRFNLYCTKPDCVFAHQSPVAPPNTPVDMETDCTFGVACKNFKCHARHPSPAKKLEHQQNQECKFGPYCTNPACAFKHTNAKPCRNGGDCTTVGCPFFHTTTECKFNPCTNLHCQYKHKEGQKTANANVWKAGGEHVSDRKFVTDEDAPEEVIIPGASSSSGGAMDATTAPSAAEIDALSG